VKKLFLLAKREGLWYDSGGFAVARNVGSTWKRNGTQKVDWLSAHNQPVCRATITLLMRRKGMKTSATVLFLCMVTSAPAWAVPILLDLTSVGSEGWVNDALYQTSDLRSAGTGVIESFVRILRANQDTVQGYNTDGRPLEFDENSYPQFTRQLPLALVPIVYKTPEGGGADVAHYEFLLDINQKGAEGRDDDPAWDLSLDKLQIAVWGSGDLIGYSTIFAYPIYDLDSAPDGDTRIILNAKINSGSGQGDMFAYIPCSLFPADPTGQYVYLYSLFGEGGVIPNNDGYEEWAVQLPFSLTLTLLSPNGNDTLTAGIAHTISWSSTGPISDVIIEYSIDNGSNWTLINTVPSTGSYEWLVPAVNSDQCLVRISDASDPSINDVSDAVFTIEVRVAVPDVVGIPQVEAESVITAAGLAVGAVTHDYSDTVRAGSVISQNPAAGSSVAIGSVVNLVISLGRRAIKIYVDADATGAGNGSSWGDAYNYLQDALAAAQSGDEIWVAKGIYKPDQGATQTPGDRTAAFHLLNGVAIYGGFAGAKDLAMLGVHLQTMRSQIELYKIQHNDALPGAGTVSFVDALTQKTDISGALYDGDDSYGPYLQDIPTNPFNGLNTVEVEAGSAGLGGGNCGWHFDTTTGDFEADTDAHTDTDADTRDFVTNETILSADLNGDDVEISNPQCLVNEPTRTENTYHVVIGSGTNASAVLDGFTITAGNANGSWPDYYGGGMFNYENSSPSLTNCTFTGNSAGSCGGGMWNYRSSPTLTNCTFSVNWARDNGGGMCNHEYCNPTLTNCTFTRNATSSRGGGGMQNNRSNPTVKGCTFIGNSAIYGGGVYNTVFSNLTLSNCTFSGNSATYGGGMFSWYSNSTLTNCTIADNNAGNGRAVGCGSDWPSYTSSVKMGDCIIWNGSNWLWNNDNSTITVTYGDVQGGWAGEGNIDADPCFADQENGDYHFRPDSPCINAGDPNYLPAMNETDIDGNPRVIGGRIDMGAYEYVPSANDLPDLMVTSEDIMFGAIPGAVNEPNTISATIHNIGRVAAENIEVVFKDFDEIIGSGTISRIAVGDSNTVTIEHVWLDAGFRLITVTADPYEDIVESDETNNSASKLYQVGDVGDMNAVIEVLCSIPSKYPEGSTANISGDAFYRIEIPGEPDYVLPVKGGSVSVKVVDSNGVPQVLRYAFTGTDGRFSMSFPVPGQAGECFDVNVAVTDFSLEGTCEGSFCVIGPEPKRDLWVNQITFAGSAPDMFIEADIHAGSDNSATEPNVPVSFYFHPPQSGTQIGSTQYIAEMEAEDSDTVSITWFDAPYGLYCIEAVLGPGYSDDNNANNTATRALAVGPEPSHIEIILEIPADINASGTTDVSVLVTDDNGNVMIPCLLETLTLDINGVDERHVDLKAYFDCDALRYVYPWQPPSDANGLACLSVTGQSVDISGKTISGADSVCADVNDDDPPNFSISARPYWAKIGQSVRITVNASELLRGDEPNSIAVTDSSGGSITFSRTAHDPCTTRWVYETDLLPETTAHGTATILVTGIDLRSNTGYGAGYFSVRGQSDAMPDFWVHSEDIVFSDENPDLGDSITIGAIIHADSGNTITGPNIPVTFYARHPAGDYQIGETQRTGQIPPGGSDSVSVLWTNTAEGWYVIEVELGPEFSDRNASNNRATRALPVGDQCFEAEDFDCDGVHNEYDNCPTEYNPDQADDDGDGVGNACDECPTDPAKTDPALCGCGVSDVDTDSDGRPDCTDGCPTDPNKTDPGICGCGVFDKDSDGDGKPDCIDACPDREGGDEDEDGVCEDVDNCPLSKNPAQSDVDGDGVGDLCDICPADGQDECDPNGSTAGEIDPNEGGTIETPDGVLRIDIDPNDFSEYTTVSVTQVDPPDRNVDLMISSNSGWGQAVAVYILEPDGNVFDSTVTVTITADVTDLNQNQRERLGVYLRDEANNVFVLVEGADCDIVENPPGTFTKICSVELEHFSTYAAMLPMEWDTRASGDFTSEGEVNWADLRIIADDWLQSGSIADIYPPPPDNDNIVDFLDFAKCADNWLRSF